MLCFNRKERQQSFCLNKDLFDALYSEKKIQTGHNNLPEYLKVYCFKYDANLTLDPERKFNARYLPANQLFEIIKKGNYREMRPFLGDLSCIPREILCTCFKKLIEENLFNQEMVTVLYPIIPTSILRDLPDSFLETVDFSIVPAPKFFPLKKLQVHNPEKITKFYNLKKISRENFGPRSASPKAEELSAIYMKFFDELDLKAQQ